MSFMNKMEQNPKIKKRIIMAKAPFVRMRLGILNYSIIANNCWGEIIYRDLHKPYLSPTVGMYFFSNDYIKFLKNLKHYLYEVELEEIPKEISKYRDSIEGDPIIGKLDDLEIIFVHCATFKEAKAKWERRIKRVNLNRLIVKFNDQNQFEYENLLEFEKLPYKNKIFVTCHKEYCISENCHYFAEEVRPGEVDDCSHLYKAINMHRYIKRLKKN